MLSVWRIVGRHPIVIHCISSPVDMFVLKAPPILHGVSESVLKPRVVYANIDDQNDSPPKQKHRNKKKQKYISESAFQKF
jgi:hypothetical protein